MQEEKTIIKMKKDCNYGLWLHKSDLTMLALSLFLENHPVFNLKYAKSFSNLRIKTVSRHAQTFEVPTSEFSLGVCKYSHVNKNIWS